MENQDNTNITVQESTKVPFFKRMSKGNFIFFVVSYSIIGILILTTILLAVIPTYTGVKFENTPDRIVLKTSSESLTLYADREDTKDDFMTIWNAYNSSNSPTVIDAMFNGYAGQGKVAKYSSKIESYASLANDTTYEVAFYWDEAQLMTDSNGKAFKYTLSTGKESTEDPYYSAATFAVSNSTNVTNATIYLRMKDVTESSTSTRYLYKGYSNFIGLYRAIEELEDADKFTA